MTPTFQQFLDTLDDGLGRWAQNWAQRVGGSSVVERSALADATAFLADFQDELARWFAAYESGKRREDALAAELEYTLSEASLSELRQAGVKKETLENYRAALRQALIDVARQTTGGRPKQGTTRSRPPASGQGGSALEAELGGAPPRVEALLSADAPKELEPGTESAVRVRIELDVPGATPYGQVTTASIDPATDIAVIVNVHGSAQLTDAAWFRTVKPPLHNEARTLEFAIRATEAGVAWITVQFMQGGTPLGLLNLEMRVTARATDERATASATAISADRADQTVTYLHIDEDRVGDEIRYRYFVTSDPLRLQSQEFHSAFVGKHASGRPAAVEYAAQVHRKLVERVLLNRDDVNLFEQEVRSIGADLARQLFDPEFLRLIWDQRDKLGVVWIATREPYIPWELAVLRHPDKRGPAALDDRFLGEYAMVRSLTGRMQPRRLRLKKWRYLAAEYPEQSYVAPGVSLSYFTQTLPNRGVQPERVAPDPASLLAALAASDLDVLHIGCHGEVQPDAIDDARLILSDRRTPPRGNNNVTSEPVTITPATVEAQVDLTGREPIVFLNACETGRQGISLTDTGGWPRAFLQAGAGAFVGTSWPVREKPASAFSSAFYEALQDGQTLAEAARQARAAAKKLGDASWLAYTVYGQPSARLES